jgi:hypothetical protein
MVRRSASGKHANIIGGSVNGQDVGNNSLTGADIADRSGVDTCQFPLVVKLGPICAGSGGQRDWIDAYNYCRGFDLRLPTVGEAAALGTNHDVPGVASTDLFWTDDVFEGLGGNGAFAVHEDGSGAFSVLSSSLKTVCVTDPSA